ncbi:MAG: RnfABCDGE type electron transport complex subunit G [Candidatus Omnitrophica bacterium]|nr:RnfABCDGE type electron transport complex subunit G [Candidatus Omnitrophota bacterium]
MSQLIKFGVILGAVCLASTLVLAFTYQVTGPVIERQLTNEEQAALRMVLPQADLFTKRIKPGLEYFVGSKLNKPIGYCVRTLGNGYGGFIKIIAGMDEAGIIKGVRILEHQETPGLGSKINEIRPGEKEPWFLRQFVGRHGGNLEVKKDIDAITGATISSRAVTEAVNKAVAEFLNKK